MAKRIVASPNRTPTFSSTKSQSVRFGRETGVASIALRLASGRPRDARNARAIARASACVRRAPGASSLRTDRNPTRSPSGD